MKYRYLSIAEVLPEARIEAGVMFTPGMYHQAHSKLGLIHLLLGFTVLVMQPG